MAHATLSREMSATLERLLSEVLELKHVGATQDRMGSARSFVDGYMCALLDSGIATQSQLLEIVRKQRVLADGAATRDLVADRHPAETVTA